jgi:hypothetical protein
VSVDLSGPGAKAGGALGPPKASNGPGRSINLELEELEPERPSGRPPAAKATPVKGVKPGPPVVTKQPEDCSVAFGDALRLEVAATGAGPMAYQWFFWEDELEGCCSPLLVIPDFCDDLVGR